MKFSMRNINIVMGDINYSSGYVFPIMIVFNFILRNHNKNIPEFQIIMIPIVDVRNNWFNNKEEAEEFYFQMKRIEDRKDFDKLYYVRKRNNTTQTK